MNRKEAEHALNELRENDSVLDTEVAELLSRLLEAENKFAILSAESAELRASRQSLLALGGDASATTNGLKNIRDRQELAEDTVAGLTAELNRKKQFAADNAKAIQAAEFNLLKVEALDLVALYNQQAREIAQTVKNVHAMRIKFMSANPSKELFTSPRGWIHCIFDQIPKLYSMEDKIPANFSEHSHLNQYFNS